jgi:hypothetical protein
MLAGPEMGEIAKNAIFLMRTFPELFDDNDNHWMKPSTSRTKYDRMPLEMNTLHPENGLTDQMTDILRPADRHSVNSRLTLTPNLFTLVYSGTLRE